MSVHAHRVALLLSSKGNICVQLMDLTISSHGDFRESQIEGSTSPVQGSTTSPAQGPVQGSTTSPVQGSTSPVQCSTSQVIPISIEYPPRRRQEVKQNPKASMSLLLLDSGTHLALSDKIGRIYQLKLTSGQTEKGEALLLQPDKLSQGG